MDKFTKHQPKDGETVLPKRAVSRRKSTKIKTSPSLSEFYKFFRGKQNLTGRPNESIGDSRPKRYSQLLIIGARGSMDKEGLFVGDNLECKMPDTVVTNIKLELLWRGQCEIGTQRAAAATGKVSHKPHADVTGGAG